MSLSNLLVSLGGPLAKRILTSLGIGIATFGAISTALNSLLDQARASYLGMGSEVLSLVQLGGFSTALSIIAGALVARVSLIAIKRLQLLS